MRLGLRHLRLRAQTTGGPYGADIPFGRGLNVIWADNTKGKSTCLQGMLYALGMERMLSPRREIPLPHVMTTFVDTDDRQRHTVLESSVSLEIENGDGQIVTVHRPIKSKVDNRLIRVDFGPTLSNPTTPARSRDFFVADPGAAAREDGFHYFLEKFIDWSLPQVRRYDAADGKLYLETIFPLFWVEQKAGWSSIPAAIPTYLRIRDVHKRAVEFILDLDVHKLELQRQRIAEHLTTNEREWRLRLDEVERLMRRNGCKSEGLPPKQTALKDDLNRGQILVADREKWIPLREMLSGLQRRVFELTSLPIPSVGDAAKEMTSELDRLTEQVDVLNAKRIGHHNIKLLKETDVGSLQRRIKALAEDLQKNQDVQKLQRFAGTVADLTPDRCPTCEQSLHDILLAQDALTAVMPIEDNIRYLRSELQMFENILKREEETVQTVNDASSNMDRELGELYSRIRTLRTDLISPNVSPSAAAVEERVRLENRIRDLQETQIAFDESIDHLRALSDVCSSLLKLQAALPSDKLSGTDAQKLAQLSTLIRSMAREFNFTTFDPSEIGVSEDTYRPQKEGFEIGFETSASDAIRLKWAYQLGLLELDATERTNHPGVLIFDEPRQQSSAKVSFEGLLKRATSAKERNQQVIFSTSEDLDNLERLTASLDCERLFFEGYIVKFLG